MAQKQRLRGFSTVFHHQMRTRVEGVKNPGNFADVLYGWSPKARALHLDHYITMGYEYINISAVGQRDYAFKMCGLLHSAVAARLLTPFPHGRPPLLSGHARMPHKHTTKPLSTLLLVLVQRRKESGFQALKYIRFSSRVQNADPMRM